jgi:hypothetical protein
MSQLFISPSSRMITIHFEGRRYKFAYDLVGRWNGSASSWTKVTDTYELNSAYNKLRRALREVETT